MAGEFTQDERPLRVVTPLGANDLLLERVEGEERISGLFHFSLDLLSEKQEIDAAALLGKPLTVEIDFDSETRYISGICSRFSHGKRGERLVRYRAELVPSFWLGTLTRDIRIHQEMAVPDIVGESLDRLGVPHDRAISGNYPPRNYCVQYRESDFDFVSRLMEEEGLAYFFQHKAGEHRMQITDATAHAPEIPARAVRIPATEANRTPRITEDPRVYDLVIEDAVLSGVQTLWDSNFQMPGKNLEAKEPVEEGDPKLELYDYPGGYGHRFDGVDSGGGEQASALQKLLDENQRTAALRARERGAGRRRVTGSSNYPMLTSGHRFSIDRHFRGDLNDEFLLTSVRHVAAVENYENSEGAPFRYENHFTCIPAAVPFAPPHVTPRPRVAGAQTATVVGPQGAEISTDKFGRVKVQFHWDREGARDASSSCWLRVSTPWAGKNWGMIAIPRVGTEVVVDFLEGDPDRPIVTGMVYHPESMPPYPLPENMTQAGIRTRSTQQGGADNFNEIRFEDKKGSEEIYLHAEKDLNAVVENNETRRVGFDKQDPGNQTLEVYNDQVVKIGDGSGEGSQLMDIKKDQKVTLATGTQTILIQQGDRVLTLDKGGETVTIKMGNRSVTLNQGNDELVLKGGNLTQTLNTGNASLELNVGNASTTAKAGSIKEEAMQGIEMKVGQNSIKIDQTGITIKGMMVKIEGQISTEVKGLMTTVKGDAMTTVKGGVTMIN